MWSRILLLSNGFHNGGSVGLLSEPMGQFPYHYERADGRVLSLNFANPNRGLVEQRRLAIEEQITDHRIELLTHIDSSVLDDEIFGLYTAKIHPRIFPDAQIEALTGDDQEIVETVIRGFRSVERKTESDGAEFKWYKKPDLPRIAEKVNQTEWRQPIPEVAGELLSNLILGHGLPNANHRSSISFVETYIQTIEPGFDFPDTGETGVWHDWARVFVRESKRILTVRRKAMLLDHLAKWGCTEVVRKNRNVIDLNEYDLQVNNPSTHYGREHRNLSIQFVYEVLERTEYDNLIPMMDPGKSVFLDRL